MTDESATVRTPKKKLTPTQFLLRGVATSLPPILTIVILTWLLRGVNDYIIYPATTVVQYVGAQFLDDSRSAEGLTRLDSPPPLDFCGTNYLVTQELRRAYRNLVPSERTAGWVKYQSEAVFVPMGDEAVPYYDYHQVAERHWPSEMPNSPTSLYMNLVAERYLGSVVPISAIAVAMIIVLLYFIGRFVNVRLGGWIISKFETRVLGRLPVIRNVYGSVKQVTDFLFSEQQVEYRRVVAIEYPRRGIWSLGLVTGESMLDITSAVGEPCLTILIPSSPMPVTGYTMSVPRSEVLDLNVTVDQAMQFCVSCGVLIPIHQKVTPELLQEQLTRRLTERFHQENASHPPTMRSIPPQPPGADETPPASG